MKRVVFKSASQETAFLRQHRGRQTDDVLREESVKELEVNVVPGLLHFLGLCQLTTLQPDMHVASFKTTTNDGRDRPSSGGICHHCPQCVEVRYDRNCQCDPITSQTAVVKSSASSNEINPGTTSTYTFGINVPAASRQNVPAASRPNGTQRQRRGCPNIKTILNGIFCGNVSLSSGQVRVGRGSKPGNCPEEDVNSDVTPRRPPKQRLPSATNIAQTADFI
ncbi:hypothetical protein LSAT2_030936 [Lamellibrachia satsuma]|nr:hypothetical protein LSAT2_030936 [Lamellibrachia satsuma]